MFKPSLNIELHYDALQEQGFGELRAVACVQYPIYCIHAKIIDSTPEQLDKFDKAILGLIQTSQLDSEGISAVLGITKRLIEERTNKLIEEGLLSGKKNNLKLTEQGVGFLEHGTEKRLRRKAIDFYIDGISLNPLNKTFTWRHSSDFISEDDSRNVTKRNGDTFVHRPFAPDLVHEVIDAETLKKNVEVLTAEERSEFEIPVGLEKVESFSLTMLTFPTLISLCDSGSVNKLVANGFSHTGDTSYMSEIVSVLKPQLSRLQILLTVQNEVSWVHNNWFEMDKSDYGDGRIFSFSQEDFVVALKRQYEFGTVTIDDVECLDKELKVDVSKDMILSSRKAPKVIDSIIRGRDYMLGSPLGRGIWILFISFRTTDTFVKEMCEVYEVYKSSETENVVRNMQSIEKQMQSSFREILVGLELNNVLEQLDIIKYMYHPTKTAS